MTDDADDQDEPTEPDDREEQTGPDEDPFEQFEADVADREGDPFEQLGGPDQERTAQADPQQPAAEEEDDEHQPSETEIAWFDEHDAGPEPGSGPEEPVDPGSESEAPGSDDADETATDPSRMTFDVGPRDATGEESDPFSAIPSREGDPFEEMGNAFEEMDVGGLDPDAVWQELASAESRGSVGEAQRRTYAEVSKHSYCEQCEYFSGPPAIECTHEGTEILEFLDMETVRLVDCPIVAERRELQESE